MSVEFSTFIPLLDQLIKGGNAKEAARRLKGLEGVRIPSEYLAELAELYMRCGFPEEGVRLLHPVVRNTSKVPVIASAEQKMEYAACLNRIGSSNEALNLLDSIDANRYPKAIFYKTFVLTTRWNYADTIDPLIKFTKRDDIAQYTKLVAMVNLADALVYEGFAQKARPLIREILYRTSLERYHLLQANCLQIAGLNEILEKKWSSARDYLERASEILKRSHSLDEFFVRKWQAILELMSTPSKKRDPEALLKVRAEALKRPHWETVRDSDRFLAMGLKDKERFLHLYFGTPYPSFRKRLLKDFRSPIDLPSEYLWKMSGEKIPSEKIFRVNPLANETGPNDLKPGHLLHRVLSSLTMDFYRPVRLASLFFTLYPEEYYDPETSRPRVHEGIRRLRNWFSEKDFPIEVSEQAGMYQLEANGPVGVIVEAQATTRSQGKYIVELRQLQARWGEGNFSVKQACDVLKLSPRSLRRVLNEGEALGLIIRVGRGATTRYRFELKQKAS